MGLFFLIFLKTIYNIAIFFYGFLIRITSLFNYKAKLFIKGRKRLFEQLKKENFSSNNIIWIHCASLGEFEQARPLIDYLKKNTSYSILLTFFSPSGYEIRKNYTNADWIYYLPLDTPKNAEKFIQITQPKIALFTKYEFWYNYLNQLKINNIPTYLFSAKFREKQIFFQNYGSFFREMLHFFTYIFVQDNTSKKLLQSIHISNCSVNGDTRFDRVIQNANHVNPFPEIELFKNNQPLLIIGSTWKADLEILIPILNNYSNQLKIIIAPHEINTTELQYYSEKLTAKSQKYTEWNKIDINFDVLFLDTIGMLSSIYQYGTFSYIGGGFGKGIHNILEAAVFGNPILFGPNYLKFGEAVELIQLNGATSIKNASEFETILVDLLQNESLIMKKATICKSFVFKNEGATQKLINHIFQ